jgi:hypothetical protein
VWGKDIRVVIIPSFLAIAFSGQSIYLHLISRFRFIASSYLASVNYLTNSNTRPTVIIELLNLEMYLVKSTKHGYGKQDKVIVSTIYSVSPFVSLHKIKFN